LDDPAWSFGVRPCATYLRLVRCCLRPGGRWIFDVRNGFGGLEALDQRSGRRMSSLAIRYVERGARWSSHERAQDNMTEDMDQGGRGTFP
jgi:hypothetical protein